MMLAVLVAALAAGLACAPGHARAAGASRETLVTTSHGQVLGEVNQDGSAVQFLGVPYAEPPVGELRWAPPQPAAAYQGVFQATADAPGCMQWCQLPPFACPVGLSEDCLTLNVFVPRGAPNSGAALPVIFFIHGGNFFQGAGGVPLYDGRAFANDTGTVVVVVNYRLGVFGFSSSEGVVDGDHGLDDQVLAMQWVQKNVAAFGGDPARVTLVGQSAGAMSIARHLAYPPSAGLFARVIMESEPFGIPFRTQGGQDEVFSALAGYLGCGATDLACMRNATSQQVLDAQNKLRVDLLVDPNLLNVFVPFTPTVSTQPLAQLLSGNFTHVPIVIGNTAQEATLFVGEAFDQPVSALAYSLLLGAIFGSADGDLIAARYPCAGPDCRAQMSQVATDGLFLCPNRNLTRTITAMPQMRGSPVFYYLFDHAVTDPAPWGNDTECYNVSCHGQDLPFVWNQVSLFQVTPDERSLARQMNQMWANFAHNADPSVDFRTGVRAAAGSAWDWPAYNATAELAMHFVTPQGQVMSAFDESVCDWWDSTVGYVWP